MFNIYLSAETIENINEIVSVTFYGLGRNVGGGGGGRGPDSCGESIKLQGEGAEILVLSFSFCAICFSLREHPVISALVSRRARGEDRKYVCGLQPTFVEGVR